MSENKKELTKEDVATIQEIIDNNQSKFDIYKQEDGWIVETGICQMGGCTSDYIHCESEEAAKRLAAELTFKGLRPNPKGLCSSCRQDLYEMQI